jgi:DNA-binding beta-propeller fold protein YncE
MKFRRYIVIALIAVIVGAGATWRMHVSAGVPAPQRGGAQAGNPAGQGRGVQNAQQNPPGPATGLLNMVGVNTSDFGIKVTQTFDASGKPAYETKGGDLLFFTNASVSYNSMADKPMVIVINARTRKIIALAEIDNMPSTPHGITLSPDGKYIYLPSGFYTGPGGRRNESGAPTGVIDAKTLKLAALVNTVGQTHHAQVFADKYIMFDSFEGALPIFLLDPATNKVVRGFPAGDFKGNPYIAFASPDGKFIYVTVRPGIARDASGREIDGWLSKIDAETMRQVATFPVGPGPVWTAITQDGKTGYVSLSLTNKLVKLDLQTGRILGTAPTGRGPYGIRLSPDEKIVYVANKGEGQGQNGATFSAINTGNMTPIREQLSCPEGLCQADHIVLSPDGKELWISNNLGSITIFDRETLKMIDNIQTPKLADPHGGTFVQISADNRSAKVVSDIGGPHGGVNPYVSTAQPAAPATNARAAAPTVGAATTIAITARNARFDPANIDVAPGQKISFDLDNTDPIDHNMVAADVGFQEVVMTAGTKKTVEWTAPTKPGVYKLVCTYHRGMEMTVTVK